MVVRGLQEEVVTTPQNLADERARIERRIARVRAFLALFFVLVGIVTATVGAILAWGLAVGLVVLGGSLLVLGALVAIAG